MRSYNRGGEEVRGEIGEKKRGSGVCLAHRLTRILTGSVMNFWVISRIS